MKNEHQILKMVYAAKENVQAEDQLIEAYMPYIKAETAKFLKHFPTEQDEDEVSIAMIAFHEAICSYSRIRGAFLKYAALVIKSRLIDYVRKEQKHRRLISLDASIEEGEHTTLSDVLTDGRNYSEEKIDQEATKEEIQELSRQMEGFGVTLSDAAETCPKQQRTLDACYRVLDYAKEHEEILEELLRTKRLPILKLSEGSGVERKTIERHRKYLVVLLLVYTNGYEIMRGHLSQIKKGEKD